MLRPGGALAVVDLGRLTLHRLGRVWPAGELFSRREFLALLTDAGLHVAWAAGNDLRSFVEARRPDD